MCGIAGELRFQPGAPVADWKKISELMNRRGPDDKGEWHDEHASMVFRRLSILDLTSAGHQPMLSQDGRYVLTFNGELYNFKELRSELKQASVRFKSDGDSEVVLNALIRWGTGALQRFNGMFAIALYDTLKKRLLLARDHAGIKPLYYMESEKGVVFASQYNQILSHPWSRQRSVSPNALSLYLNFAFVPAPYALHRGISMLEPGTWRSIGLDGHVEDGTFFSFPMYQPPTLRGAEAVEALDHALSLAVERQMVSDVPVASFLSGGIDSPLVLSRMCRMQTKPITAFTIGTDDPNTDETIIAETYAKELGVDHVVSRMSEHDALSELDNVVSASSEPFGDYSIFPTILVSRLAAQNFKVILSGDGGDELLWGYVNRMADSLKMLPTTKRKLSIRRIEWILRRLFGVHAKHRHLLFPNIGAYQAFKHRHLRGAANIAKVFPDLPPWPDGYHQFDYSGHDLDETAQWLRWNEFSNHLTKVLLKVDRASMHESLEVRVPLLDREFIEVALQVDWTSCLNLDSMTGKIPLRRLLKENVRHQSHAKRGFEIPMGKWLRTSLKDQFNDLVLEKEELLGLRIDKSYLRKAFDLHLQRRADLSRGLWPLLSLALWEAQFSKPREAL